MAKAQMQKGRKQQRRRAARVPRGVSSVGTVAVIRRVLEASQPRGVTDQGYQLGVVPGNLSDWSQLQALWARYRMLRTRFHFVQSGDYDGTPAYPTFWTYHDLVSAGAPTSLSQAFLKKGVKALSFNAANTKRTFDVVPMVWTSNAFITQVPSPQMYVQTAASYAPSFSSVAFWGLNYNTAVASCPITCLIEMMIEFSEPN